MVPKQRKGGSFGGSGHGESKFKSVRRGGRPGAGRAKSGGLCLVWCIAGCGVLAVAAGAVSAVVS